MKRWPIILTKIIDQIHRENHEITMRGMKATDGAESTWEAQADEGKSIIEKVSRLKYEMARDRELQYVEFITLLHFFCAKKGSKAC